MLPRFAALAALSLLATAAQASVTTYTDRAAFQAALASYTVDNLNDMGGGWINPNSSTPTFQRTGYAIGGEGYACHYWWDCGDAAAGISGDFLVTIPDQTLRFTFDAPVKAFGFDWANDWNYANTPGNITLNGETSAAHRDDAAFFGIIADEALSQWSVGVTLGYGSQLDNLTFGDAVPVDAPTPGHTVPEPATALLLGVSAAGMLAARRRRAA